MIILDSDNPDVEDVEELKQDRDLQEVDRVDNLMKDFEAKVKVQEQLFRLFSEHYKDVAAACQKSQVSQEIEKLICQSTLDRWAFHLDRLQAQECMVEQTPETVFLGFKQDLAKVERQRQGQDITGPLGTLTEAAIRSLIRTPLRRLFLAKVLAATDSDVELNFAKKIFDELIAADSQCYPAAHYYKAYLMVKKSHDMLSQLDEVLKELYAAERLLSQQVSLNYYLAGVVNCFASNSQTVLFSANSYRKQKENENLLLEFLRGSIRRIVGGHCSLEKLSAFVPQAETAERAYKFLSEKGLIEPCCINPPKRFHNYNKMVAKVANNYGIEPALMTKFFAKLKSEYKGGFESKQLKKEIQTHFKSGIFEHDRKAFWDLLVDHEALVDSQIVLGIRVTELENNEVLRYALEKCFKVPEQPILLCIEEADNQSELQQDDFQFYLKEEVKSALGSTYKKLKKKYFVSNRFAKINQDVGEVNKFNEANVWGKISLQDLISVGIDSREAKSVFEHLVKTGFIDPAGFLKEIDPTWKYPSSQTYEDSIKNLLGKKNMCKNIWLSIVNGKASDITYLPLKLAKELREDLFQSRLIQYPTISQAKDFSLWHNPLAELFGSLVEAVDFFANFPNQDDRQPLLQFIDTFQASFVQMSGIDARLSPVIQLIDSASRANNSQFVDNIHSELEILKLSGFDEILLFKDDGWINKLPIKLGVITTMGLSHLAVGAAMFLFNHFFVCRRITGKSLILEGFRDIMFAFTASNAQSDFTFNEYTRQKYNRLVLKPTEVSLRMLMELPTVLSDQYSDAEMRTLSRAQEIISQVRKKLSESSDLVHHGLKQIHDEIDKSCQQLKNNLNNQTRDTMLKSVNEELAECFKQHPNSASSIFENTFEETFKDMTSFTRSVGSLTVELNSHLTSSLAAHKGTREIMADFRLEDRAMELLKAASEKFMERFQKILSGKKEKNVVASKKALNDAVQKISEEMIKRKDFLLEELSLALQNTKLLLKLRGYDFELSIRDLIHLEQKDIRLHRQGPTRVSQK